MRSRRWVAALVTVGASALAFVVACGPPCADDRCSLKASTPQTTRVDYTRPTSTTGTVTSGSAAPATGSAAPAAGSAVAVAVPTAGSGSAAPATGSAAPVAAGSAAPPVKPAVPTPSSAAWELWDGNQFKMYVISRGSVAANTKLTFEFVKTPVKTPFVVTLEVRPPGGSPAAEGVWNDCPENKIRCDQAGAKTHVTKKAGQILIQAGINWTVTAVADEAKGTLVTWTNNLSREVFSLRLIK